jgi:hypothetical protein
VAVSKKNRRRIEVAGRPFVWYVCEDRDWPGLVLHVISEDQRFVVTYRLAQRGEPFLIVLGREFPGVPDAGCAWRRFRCPAWEVDGVVTPGGVRRLIEWCLAADKPLVEVDWRNRPLPDTA